MPTAMFFLLLSIWMQELSLMGLRPAGLAGVALLLAAALAVHGHQRARSIVR